VHNSQNLHHKITDFANRIASLNLPTKLHHIPTSHKALITQVSKRYAYLPTQIYKQCL